jgi:hypothetical protein
VKLAATVFLVLAALIVGCAIPQIEELRSVPVNAQFIVNAPVDCLYDKGVGHVSSYIGMSEPKFTWYTDASRKYAWFRQPLTLIEIRAVNEGSTDVRRSQTPSAASFGQGNELLAYLKSNPCSPK